MWLGRERDLILNTGHIMNNRICKTAAAIAVAGVLSLGTVGGANAASGVNAWFPNGSWPAVWIVAGAGSIIGDAAFVQATQCRELNAREVLTSAVLPVIGWVFNDNTSKCKVKK